MEYELKEFKKFLKYFFTSKLLIIGFIIYLTFNISALGPHFYDFFFFGSSVHHCCQGLDFYQIPNGMYAFLHGGSLSGVLPFGLSQYSQGYMSNFNVYHPLLTITLGGFFILFNPNLSFHLWIIIKLFITIAALFYFYKNFQGNKYLNLAMFLFLTNFSQYNEIKISQYQFLFNIFLLLFLINIVKNKDRLEGGILFFLTLIAKPIGLLWMPVLYVKRKFTILIIGINLFIISTITFNILKVGQYYTYNLIYHLFTPIQTKGIDVMSLDSLLRNAFHISVNAVTWIKFIYLGIVYLITFSKKVHILKAVFFLVVYFLFFYDLIYQYHFSVLGPLLSVCLLTLPEFQTKIAKILIIIINMPSVFFVLRIINLGVYNNPILGVDPTFTGWTIVSFFQLLPILLLAIIVLIPDIKSLVCKIHALH
jgi:hypothetical protein